MKLYYSPTSPYVRKVSITATVTGLADSIERIAANPHPVNRDQGLVQINPLGKAPTLVTDDGLVLFDSRVIVEYLDAQSRAARVIPAVGAARWRALAQQALGDGLLDAALLIRYEGVVRPPEHQSQAWRDGQFAKLRDGLATLEPQAGALGQNIDVGTIAIGAALGFFDFRLTDFDWRTDHPALADWFAAFDSQPAIAATRPVAPTA